MEKNEKSQAEIRLEEEIETMAEQGYRKYLALHEEVQVHKSMAHRWMNALASRGAERAKWDPEYAYVRNIRRKAAYPASIFRTPDDPVETWTFMHFLDVALRNPNLDPLHLLACAQEIHLFNPTDTEIVHHVLTLSRDPARWWKAKDPKEEVRALHQKFLAVQARRGTLDNVEVRNRTVRVGSISDFASHVWDKIVEATESIEPLGPTLGYLLPAILSGTYIDIVTENGRPEDKTLLEFLKKTFSATHAIWGYISVNGFPQAEKKTTEVMAQVNWYLASDYSERAREQISKEAVAALATAEDAEFLAHVLKKDAKERKSRAKGESKSE